MSEQEILEKLQAILGDVLQNPDLIITKESSGENVDDWDSFSNIQITMAIEKFFDIRFALADLEELNNVGDLILLIEKKTTSK